jgi:sigma-B regulation protein RsbU (phosphoserine phosphatase)
VSGTGPRDRSGIFRRIAAGLLVLAAGAALALALLPEWSAGDLGGERLFVTRYRGLAARSGFQLTSGRPRVSLTAGGETVRDPRSGRRSSLRVEVRHAIREPGETRDETLEISFSPAGQPRKVSWENFGAPIFGPQDPSIYDRVSGRMLSALLAPGESLVLRRQSQGMGFIAWKDFAVAGSSPRERLHITISPPYTIEAERLPEAPAAGSERDQDKIEANFARFLVYLALFLAVVGVFLALLARGQIDLINGAVLALATLLSANLAEALSTFQPAGWMSYFLLFVSAPGLALWVFLVWSAGESLLRSLRPDFTTSLDTLRLGRLGPRGGRALLLGFGFGAGLAGLRLALHALAEVLAGVAPNGPSLSLPVISLAGSPLASGISAAAVTALALALALRFLPGRWALPAASLLAGYVISPFHITPFAAQLAASVAFAAILAWVCRRYGLTALLAASVTAFLLPAALFSGLHLAWLPGSFAVTSGLTALLVLCGVVGISRSEEEESGQVPTPAFMRRLAEERRIRHEVDLLARMQEGLLPQEMPRVEGYQIAARSLLASEAGGDLYDFLRDDAGGLWIAAGDVAGHGYSCAVAQAMVKAGLLSLVEPGETPAGVLRRLDQVLRDVSTDHSFTSLALIRLDPATGEALFANAGHPYPLVAEFGRVSEIDLPGLPLGRGPAQDHADRSFRLPPGSALVLCSDGLFEALDRNGNAYGFERAREVVRAMGHRPAVEILDALLNDCRRHLGAEAAPDDVTVVVVKRA